MNGEIKAMAGCHWWARSATSIYLVVQRVAAVSVHYTSLMPSSRDLITILVACARTCGGVLVCLAFHFGQCTNPICMSLILDDVHALGGVCDGEDVCVPS